MTEIQEFYASTRDRVDTARIEKKRRLFDLFDIRGKLTLCPLAL